MMSTVPLWLALYVEAAAKADRRSVGQFITNAVIDQIGSSDPDQLRALFKRVVDGIKRLDHESQRAVALEFIDALHSSPFNMSLDEIVTSLGFIPGDEQFQDEGMNYQDHIEQLLMLCFGVDVSSLPVVE